jgi:putative ABC transport system substrate-binding protein
MGHHHFMRRPGGRAALRLVSRDERSSGLRRVAVLACAGAERDPVQSSSVAKFREGLARLDWMEGRNLHIDVRCGGINADRNRTLAAELIRLAPDVIVTETVVATKAVHLETRNIPIVMTETGDVDGGGLAKSLAQAHANIMRVTNLYAAISRQWLGLLKRAAPAIERVALLRSETATGGPGQCSICIPAIEEAAQVLGVEVIDKPYPNMLGMVRAIDAFAEEPAGALIVLPPFPGAPHREIIHELSKQHRLPAICGPREFAVEGGLMSYGSTSADVWRLAASFVDCILRGACCAEVTLDMPTKFPLTINTRVAKAIDLTLPDELLQRADELIA